jgi:hypothetical protein
VGCPHFGGNLCSAELSLTDDGQISEIIVTYSTP